VIFLITIVFKLLIKCYLNIFESLHFRSGEALRRLFPKLNEWNCKVNAKYLFRQAKKDIFFVFFYSIIKYQKINNLEEYLSQHHFRVKRLQFFWLIRKIVVTLQRNKKPK